MEKLTKTNCGYSHKVIPLIFDESLSYYEQVCKLVSKMNEIIDFANDEISIKIKEFIDKEFNNIMLDALYDEENETLIFYLKKEGK